MMDIIVTTPKREMATAAREAEDCKRAGGGEYFRRLPVVHAPMVLSGDRIYYVEDGAVRGFAVVKRIYATADGLRCDTTGRQWPPGVYVFMGATTWHWIRPIPMKGFQGFRYAKYGCSAGGGGNLHVQGRNYEVCVVGGWREYQSSRWKKKGRKEAKRRRGRPKGSKGKGWHNAARGSLGPANVQRKRRMCLACGKRFMSGGPGNRRCEKCTKLLSGVVETPTCRVFI